MVGLKWDGIRNGRRGDYRGAQETFGGCGYINFLDNGDELQVCTYVKSDQAVDFKSVVYCI